MHAGSPYSLLLPFAVSFFALSLNSRRNILPIAFFGISSTNTTPPTNQSAFHPYTLATT